MKSDMAMDDTVLICLAVAIPALISGSSLSVNGANQRGRPCRRLRQKVWVEVEYRLTEGKQAPFSCISGMSARGERHPVSVRVIAVRGSL